MTTSNVSDETIIGGGTADTIRTSSGSDQLFGQGGADIIRAGGGDDVIFGDGSTSGAVETEDFRITQAVEATVTFDGETAGFRNTLGVYKIDDDGNISDVEILFGNASLRGSGGDLIANESSVGLSLDAGDRLGFFVVPNGFSQAGAGALLNSEGGSFRFVDADGNPANINGESELTLVHTAADGTETDVRSQYGTTVFHSVTGQNNALNADGLQHVTATADALSGTVQIGFEDLLGGGDNDFDDSVFTLDIGVTNTALLPRPQIEAQAVGDRADNIRGGSGDDLIFARADDDFVAAGQGDDVVFGNSGDDDLRGNAGEDSLYGGSGDDQIRGGGDADELFGNSGDDFLSGGAGNDVLSGNEGNDRLIGGGDDDILNGDRGDDDLRGSQGNDTLFGNSGSDDLRGGSGSDFLSGGTDDDRLFGGSGSDDLRGGRGNDDVRGGQGNDELRGDSGDDVARGGGGDDIVRGGEGNDRLFGNDGADELFGGRQDDVLFGGAGDDVLLGDSGNDVLRGGTGADVLRGGSGADSFVWTGGDLGAAGDEAIDTILGFSISGGDVLDLSRVIPGSPETLEDFVSLSENEGGTLVSLTIDQETVGVVQLDGLFDLTVSDLQADGAILA